MNLTHQDKVRAVAAYLLKKKTRGSWSYLILMPSNFYNELDIPYIGFLQLSYRRYIRFDGTTDWESPNLVIFGASSKEEALFQKLCCNDTHIIDIPGVLNDTATRKR